MDQQFETFNNFEEFEQKCLPQYYQMRKSGLEVSNPGENIESMMLRPRFVTQSVIPCIPLLSSTILNDWLSPEEDEAWDHL